MGQLLEAFLKNPFRFVRKKYSISKTTERRKIRRLTEFLEFCERQGRRKFTQIQQKDWTNFCRHKRNQGLGDESMRQYALVVSEFAQRAHIDLRVNPSNFRSKKKRQKTGRQASSAS
jgi:site-specific recombinase XerC